MYKIQSIIISIVAMIFVLGSTGVVSAEADISKDLANFICKDIMRTSGEDRDIALAFAHGYLLGKKGTTTYSPSKLGAATDEFIETCLDNPKANALKTLSDILNKQK